jgi:hypothetical protein
MSLYIPKFPFWSAIITQSQGSVYCSTAGTVYYVTIQPPAGETWLIWLDFYLDYGGGNSYVRYEDYNGTAARWHSDCFTGGTYGSVYPHLGVMKILTNSLYGRMAFVSGASGKYGYYGYSGFKLSQPLWSPKRLPAVEPKPWKKPRSEPLPDLISALDKYAYDILGIDPSKPEEYALGIILEEDTPLAIDPATGFPVERLTAVVKADVLADLIAKFKAGTADPVATGYRRYLGKWKAEDIDLGV